MAIKLYGMSINNNRIGIKTIGDVDLTVEGGEMLNNDVAILAQEAAIKEAIAKVPDAERRAKLTDQLRSIMADGRAAIVGEGLKALGTTMGVWPFS